MGEGREKGAQFVYADDSAQRTSDDDDFYFALWKRAGLVFGVLLISLTGMACYEYVVLGSTRGTEKCWALARSYRLAVCFWAVAAACAVHSYGRRPGRTVYLVDFSCYKADDDTKINYEVSEYFTRGLHFSLPSMDFQRKVFVRSGLGEETYIPRFAFSDKYGSPGFGDARLEAHEVMFGCVDDLLRRTGVSPSRISVVVTNCSLFTPIPSHSAILVNHLGLRDDCQTFHLTGMGCSASLIACQLAADVLRESARHANKYALVVSSENITLSWYFGNERPMLVTNCLFRVGCAAMLLTNRRGERARAKYELAHVVRTHTAADDRAYGCAYQRDDAEGYVAVGLNKDLMGVAAEALRTNIRTLAPLILPVRELLRYAWINVVCRKVLNLTAVKQYTPDFKLAVDHFCLHAGGRAVIDEIQRNLLLDDFHMEPARAALHRFGNTSTSTIWYVLAYMEAQRRVKRGQKVWMMGLGSGFKCNSGIWKALRDISPPPTCVWGDCIHRYPAAVLQDLAKMKSRPPPMSTHYPLHYHASPPK